MNFGRVEGGKLNELDLSLPQEPSFNKQILPGIKDVKARFYVGCPRWGTPEWLGKIYPPNTKEKDFLDLYVQHFNSIELNATHTKIPDLKTIQQWKKKVGTRDFLFCPKMYKGITHFGKLTGKDVVFTEFVNSIRLLEQHLGPVFIQLSDNYSSDRKAELFEFLQGLPMDIQFFLEVRHPDWFKEVISKQLFETLHALNVGAVITDTPLRRDCAHMHLTIPKTFIRYVGNSLQDADYNRINAWVERIKYWLNEGINAIYFFAHMPDEVTAPELTVYLIEKLNAECGLNLIKPSFVNTILF